jgi:hypothetical protein
MGKLLDLQNDLILQKIVKFIQKRGGTGQFLQAKEIIFIIRV